MNFEEIKEDKIYKIDISKDITNNNIFFLEFTQYDGLEITGSYIKHKWDFSGFFKFEGYWFSNKILVETRKKCYGFYQLKESRKEINFEEGDLVKIRSLEDLKKDLLHGLHEIIVPTRTYNINLLNAETIGEEAEIIDYDIFDDDDTVTLNFLNKKFGNYKVSTKLIEMVEKGYRNKKMKERTEKIVKPSIPSDDEIIKEMISKVDICKFKKILASTLQTKASSLEGVIAVLNDWAVAKKELYLILGRNLTCKKKISYKMSELDLKENISILCKKFPESEYVLREISVDDYGRGKISENSYLFDRFPFLKEGMKIGTFLDKAFAPKIENSFKNLSEEEKNLYLKLDKKVVKLNPVELEYSRLFANKEVNGNIAISINPIDYLLMSVNQSGWHSCYTILHSGSTRAFDWGEYSAGIFSYMCDSTTIVTYRHNDTIEKYKIGNNHFEEYSKNWRQLIYLDTNTYSFACSRQYPFADTELSKKVREFLEEKLSNYLQISNIWKKKIITDINMLRKIIRKYSFYNETLSYNDILNRGEGIFVYNKELDNFSKAHFNVDSDCVCVKCGRRPLDCSNIIICSECLEEMKK